MHSAPPALLAEGPHPALEEPMRLFGQFVGTWDVRIRFYDASGARVFDEPGEWTFFWTLDGRVIQDVLTYPFVGTPPDEPGPHRRIGTSVRMYDRKRGDWRVVWFGATSGYFVILRARPEGRDIVLDGFEDDARLRWMFTEVTQDGFHWKGFRSEDGGVTWALDQEILGRRSR